MNPYDNVPLGTPPLRYDDLNETHTRHDRLVAAPSDEDLILFWILWVVLLAIVSSFTFLVFISALSSRKVRKNPFNVYLIFLMVPDLVFSALCALTCLMNAIAGHYWSPWMCKFQSFYITWGIGANAWLNAVIAYQVHTMLQHSFARRRFRPPAIPQVITHVVIIYLYMAFIASWSIADISWLPTRTITNSGAVCIPGEYDRPSTIFQYLCFIPFFIGIPIIYVCYVLYDVWSKQLLPESGKARTLSIYFTRLIGVFIIMWIPSLGIFFFVTPYLNPWFMWAAGSWGHLQGAVSAAASIMKPDIMLSVHQFVTCHCNDSEMEEVHDMRSVATGTVSVNFNPRDTRGFFANSSHQSAFSTATSIGGGTNKGYDFEDDDGNDNIENAPETCIVEDLNDQQKEKAMDNNKLDNSTDSVGKTQKTTIEEDFNKLDTTSNLRHKESNGNHEEGEYVEAVHGDDNDDDDDSSSAWCDSSCSIHFASDEVVHYHHKNISNKTRNKPV